MICGAYDVYMFCAYDFFIGKLAQLKFAQINALTKYLIILNVVSINLL
jgi:hypothetical protein